MADKDENRKFRMRFVNVLVVIFFIFLLVWFSYGLFSSLWLFASAFALLICFVQSIHHRDKLIAVVALVLMFFVLAVSIAVYIFESTPVPHGG